MKMVPGGGPWIINAATPWRGVRTKTHTYARLADGGPWILFDNKNDPYQMKNLVNDPAHKKLRGRDGGDDAVAAQEGARPVRCDEDQAS